MPIPTPKVSFNNIAKHPLVYALIIIAMIAGFFVHSFTGTSEDRIKDCNEQITYLRSELEKRDSLIRVFQTDLFIKNNIIKDVPNMVDSLAKEKRNELKR